jgi:DNA polymerase phi
MTFGCMYHERHRTVGIHSTFDAVSINGICFPRFYHRNFVKIWPRRSVPMSTTLPLFWDLSSVEKKKRLDASVKLISTLEKFQVAFERRSAESDASSNEDDIGQEEDVQDVGVVGNMECDTMLDALNAPDVAYSIRRLVRGLGSPRESSRLGFAVALTEVCAKLQMYI